jgi:hypothetical protein
MSRTRSTTVVMNALAALLLVVATGANQLRADDDKGETFTAFGVNLSNVGTGRNARVDITIDRWSTEEEREQLRTVLVERGTEAMYRELQKMKTRWPHQGERQPWMGSALFAQRHEWQHPADRVRDRSAHLNP